jgi:hypothetical protein
VVFYKNRHIHVNYWKFTIWWLLVPTCICQGDILSIKTIPKPYEDLNDAFTIFKYLEKTQSN